MDNIKNLWWGYKHISGIFQAKRYYPESPFSKEAVLDAYDSDFVDQVVEPFEANGREEALEIVKQQTI